MSDFTVRIEVTGLPANKKPAPSKMMERCCFCAAIAQTSIAALYAIVVHDFWDCLIVFTFASNWWLLGLTYRLHRFKSERLLSEAIRVAKDSFIEFVRRQDEFRP